MNRTRYVIKTVSFFLSVSLLAAALTLTARPMPARAATVMVTSTNDSGPGTLRQAIIDAASGDTITFAPALTAGGPATIDLSTPDADISYGLSAFTISKTLTIQGPTGPNGITIERAVGIPNLRLFYVMGSGALTLQNITLSNGLAQGQAPGSGYQRSGYGGGGAGLGGAIFNQGQLNLMNSTLTGNQAIGGPGSSSGYSGGGGGGGGGLAGLGANGGTPDESNYYLGGDGGAPLGGAGSPGKDDVRPYGNDGGVGGGGGGGGSGRNTTPNPGGPGGAGGFGGGGGGGGAYDSWGNGGVPGGAGGAGGFGGGGGGGGGGTPGGAGGLGGFGGSNGQPGDNSGNVGGVGGGGAGLGGAVFNDGGTLSVINSTLSGNTTSGASGFGGAIFSRNGTTTILYSTLATNSANEGGGLYLLGDGAAANATLNGTIVAATSGGADVQAAAINAGSQTTSGADNLIQNNGNFAGGFITGDPLLGPLQDNGGPTWTRALVLGSPALDVVPDGNNGCGTTVSTDQRGASRPIPAGGACDLGAYELSAFDVGIVKTVSGSLFTPGEAITYTLAFSNTSNLTATQVIITDSVPSAVINLNYSITGATITNTGTSPAYVWDVQDLPPHASGTITITGSIDPALAAGATLTNTAIIMAENDGDPNNNASTVTSQMCLQHTYTVTDTGDSGPGTLRQAVIDACPNATIDFNLTYPDVITLTTGEILINKNLTILGPGANNVRVDGNHASGVLSIAPDVTVTINNLTISDGNSTGSGGGIFADVGTTLNLSGLSLSGNTAANSGGGLYVDGTATLTDTDVIGNIANGSWYDDDAGGGAYFDGDVTLVGGRFENNQATDSVGGGLFTWGSLNLSGTAFISNTASLAGGGAQVLGTAWLTNSWFERNQSNGGGGGGGLRAGELFLTNTTFISNTAVGTLTGGGGALVVTGSGSSGNASLSGGQFISNTTDGSGGGLYVAWTATLIDTDVIGNIANGSWDGGGGYAGGGAYFNRDVTLVGGHFENNQATDSVGGGLFTNRSLSVSGTVFISNTAFLAGGGTQVLGTAWLTNGWFERNQSNGGGGGGGLRANELFLTDTTFISNTAVGANFNGGGGGVLVANGGGATLNGGQFIGNTTDRRGGGLLSMIATLTDSDFLSNTSAAEGGGVYANGAATLNGGMFYNDTSGGDGGGLNAQDTLALTGTQFISNTATANGGGVYALRNSRIVNALFADNTTDVGGSGAAMLLFSIEVFGDSTEIVHTTIVGPAGSTAPAISAINLASNGLAITNTIVASYTTGIATDGPNIVSDYNLFYNAPVDGIAIGAHSITGTNPLLADPAGGDYHLTSGSPALDAGAFAGVTTDIDGDARPTTPVCFDAPDIGADEFTGLTVQRPVTDTMTFGATHARLIFTDSASVSFITMTVAPGQFPTSNPSDEVVSRTITIQPDIPGAVVSATLSLCYDPGELKPGLPEPQLQLYRWTGSSWQPYSSTVDTINHLVTTSDVTGFSHWLIGNLLSTPTAVTLRDVSAHSDANPMDPLVWMLISAGAVGLLLTQRQWRQHRRHRTG